MACIRFFLVFLVFGADVYARDIASVTLDQYIQEHHEAVTEGHIGKYGWKKDFFRTLIRDNPQIKIVGEIGFNAGHSSEVFLTASLQCTVISFDVMKTAYSKIGKQYIDLKYPGRHELVLGDSLVSVREFSTKNNTLHFDVIFVDGCHFFNWTYNDIKNMQALACPETFLVVDDINYPDVAKAWEKCVQEGIVIELQRHKGNSGLVLGKYCFPTT